MTHTPLPRKLPQYTRQFSLLQWRSWLWVLVGALLPLLSHALPDTWATTSSLTSGRYGHTATLLPTGKVLVVGGWGPSATRASAEVFDPANNNWSAAGGLTVARAYHSATLLPTGKVLITGGTGGFGTLASAELYDPISNSWSTAGSLSVGRSDHTATLLPSGKVLLAGGADDTGNLSSAEVYDPASNAWSATGSLATARYSHTATLLASGKVLVTGGIGSSGSRANAELFDPTSNTWSTAGSMSTAHHSHTATLLASGKVLVAGGQGGSSSTISELYNPTTNTWSAAGSLGTGRSSHSASLLPSGKVLVAGGFGTSTAELYDPASNTWSTSGSMATARQFHTATLLPLGKVLVVGGENSGSSLASAELFDSGTSTWSPATALTGARENHTGTLLPSGKVLVAGGTSSGSVLSSAALYDPASNTWSAAGSMNQARGSHTATLLHSGKVLVAGGVNSGGALAGAELYDPGSNSWSTAGSLATARYVHTATLLATGKVLAAAGLGTSGDLASAEVYDPASNTWAAVGNLATARDYHTATLLPSGKVLVAGGYGSGYLSSAELFDPASNTWSAAGNLSTARRYHTATMLHTGKVLAVGGYNGAALSSAELYDPGSNTWGPAASMATARRYHTTTLLPTGQVLAVAGHNGAYLDAAEMYDAASNTWETAGTLGSARVSHATTLLPSGKLLVSGGNNGSTLTSAELFELGLSIPAARRPALTDWNARLQQGDALQLTGSAFTGDSEASGGGTNQSASNIPMVQLRRMDGDLTRWARPLPGGAFSASTFQSTAMSGVALGYYAVTVFVNGVPSSSALVPWVPSRTVTPGSSGNGSASPSTPQTVAEGNTISFTFTGDAGYSVTSVTGTCGGNLVGSVFTTNAVSVDCSVTGNFTLNTYAITATNSPTGGGTSSCSPNPFNHGTSSTCSASPNAGYSFAGWTGDCTGGSCTLSNVQAAKNVTANFTLNSYTVSTVTSPTAGGSVSCAPNPVPHGNSTTCTATPNAGYVLTNWSGDCSGTSCSLSNVQSAKSVTANFSLNTYTISTTASPSAGGSVACSPNPVSHGSNATCTATANAGYSFLSWSGDCSGTTATCTLVSVQAGKSVSASFAVTSRLINIATRAQVLTGDNVMIGGFILQGSTPKQILVRARGPSMAAPPFNVPGTLPNPMLQLFSGASVIASNDNWGDAANAAAITATGWAPSDPLESAILTTVNPGAYTAIVSGSGGVTGVGIVEVFEVDHPEAPLINIATRAQVLAGDNVMIGGFIIQGDTAQTVLIRARGPSMAAPPFNVPGTLPNPVLQLFSGASVIASNDDWQSNANSAAITATGLAPSDALESALLVTLNPGAYTAIISGAGGATGVGIVEVFAR